MGKHLHKNATKMNISLRVAAVLLCLTLFSEHFVAGLFARYTTSAQSSDQARVAKFSIEGDGALSESIAAELVPGGSQEVQLVVKNNSEVAVEYTVEVANVTKNLPLRLRIWDGVSEFPEDANGIKFTVQRLPGGHNDEYTLTINWPVTEDKDRDPDKMGMVDYVAVTVTAVQID